MISFPLETQRSVSCTSITSHFVLLAALCCCNGLLLQGTVTTAGPSDKPESSTMPDMTEQPDAAAVDLGSLLDAGNGAIVTLVAGNTRLAAHRAVLASGSPRLSAMFPPNALGASSSEVDVPDVEGAVLRQLVAFLYTGRAPQLPSMAPQLLAAAGSYGMVGLMDACEQQVLKQLNVKSAAAAAVVAVRHSRHSLREAVIDFMRAHILQVLATQGWADAVIDHPREVVQITHLLAAPPAMTSATTATTENTPPITAPPTADSTHTTTTAVQAAITATPNTPDSTSTSTTAAAPTTTATTRPHSDLNQSAATTLPSDASAVSHLWSLSTEEKARRLMEAAKEGSVDQVRALFAAGVDVQARDTVKLGFTALHWAARNGHVEVARCILQAGAAVEARDSDWQQTPLHYAAIKGHTAVIKLLLEASADIDARNKMGATPLTAAAGNGHEQAVAVLIEARADVEPRSGEWQQTPLHWAAMRDHAAVVRSLLEASADVNAWSKDGLTPLHLAAQWGQEEAVTALLEAGAERGARDDKGMTALDWAKLHHQRLIQMLQ